MSETHYKINSHQILSLWIKKDRIANGLSPSSSIKERIKNIFLPNYIIIFLYHLRMVEYLTNCCSKTLFGKARLFFNMIKLRRLRIKLGFSIPINVFGPGLSIPHIGTIVVNSKAKIGANCRIHTCVNIGASGGGDGAPCLGDNVYLGPGAILFGDIQIANKVTIGANATVNKSCEKENVVLAGSPAVVVKEKYPCWVEFNNVKDLL